MGKYLDTIISGNIKNYRINNKFTKEEMAQILQITDEEYDAIEKNQFHYEPEHLLNYSTHLRVTPSSLLEPGQANALIAEETSVNYYRALIDKMQTAYEARINDLKEEVKFLRSLLNTDSDSKDTE